MDSPKAWLSAVTTRLAIDHLRSARIRRSHGRWARASRTGRQLAARARRHVEAGSPRFTVDRQVREELFDRFVVACETGDVDALKHLLAADAVIYSDGGGKVTAARRPVVGADRVARVMMHVTRRRMLRVRSHALRVTVNGQPGLIVIGPDRSATDVMTIDVADGAIQTVRIVRNPDKLRHLRTRGILAAAYDVRESHTVEERRGDGSWRSQAQ